MRHASSVVESPKQIEPQPWHSGRKLQRVVMTRHDSGSHLERRASLPHPSAGCSVKVFASAGSTSCMVPTLSSPHEISTSGIVSAWRCHGRCPATGAAASESGCQWWRASPSSGAAVSGAVKVGALTVVGEFGVGEMSVGGFRTTAAGGSSAEGAAGQPHEKAHFACMNTGIFSHSPDLAHLAHVTSGSSVHVLAGPRAVGICIVFTVRICRAVSDQLRSQPEVHGGRSVEGFPVEGFGGGPQSYTAASSMSLDLVIELKMSSRGSRDSSSLADELLKLLSASIGRSFLKRQFIP